MGRINQIGPQKGEGIHKLRNSRELGEDCERVNEKKVSVRWRIKFTRVKELENTNALQFYNPRSHGSSSLCSGGLRFVRKLFQEVCVQIVDGAFVQFDVTVRYTKLFSRFDTPVTEPSDAARISLDLS